MVPANLSPTEAVLVGSTDAPETTTQVTLNVGGDVSASSGKDTDDKVLSSSIVAVVVIAVIFALLVVIIVYACYRRPNKVAPMEPSFSAPDPVRVSQLAARSGWGVRAGRATVGSCVLSFLPQMLWLTMFQRCMAVSPDAEPSTWPRHGTTKHDRTGQRHIGG